MRFLLSLLPGICAVGNLTVAQNQYFFDDPPSDYFQRKSLDDCPNRFYSDRFKFILNRNFDAYGGKRAVQGEFMHMAALGWNVSGSTVFKCGGSLITSKFVLTAAHCMVYEGIPPVVVRLGDTNVATVEDDQLSQQIKIKVFKRHPQHSFRRKDHDIALVELEEEVKFNTAICTACLWLESVPKEPMNAVGFGITGFLGDPSPTLQKVTVSKLRRTECMKRLPRRLQKTQFCAANTNQDTCQGDSGGPIQIERVDVNGALVPMIVGVVSYGNECVDGSTGVHTRVAFYKDWIEQVTAQSFSYSACARTTRCPARKLSSSFMIQSNTSPFHRVGLSWDSSNLNEFQCGATLVDYRFVLTSAYCAVYKHGFPKFILVRGQSVSIESVHIHPEYSLDRPEYDLALLKLTKYLNPSLDLLPACLWREAELGSNYMFFSAYSSRFKSVEDFREEDYDRYTVATSVLENGNCTKAGNRAKNLLCGANSVKMIPKVCKIDYGASVTNVFYIEDIPHIYGVVSTLSKSCDKELVAIRVAPHTAWIEKTILEDIKNLCACECVWPFRYLGPGCTLIPLWK